MKTVTLKSAKAKAWKQFSLWIRLSHRFYLPDSDEQSDEVECYTCGAIKNWKMTDAGHGIPGRSNAVLFLEDVVRPQCKQCNIFKNGRLDVFQQKLREEMGQETFDNIIFMSHQTVKYSIQEYLDIYEKYKDKLMDLAPSK